MNATQALLEEMLDTVVPLPHRHLTLADTRFAGLDATLQAAFDESEPHATTDRGTLPAEADVVHIDRRARREAEQWARRVVQAAVEAVGGTRPTTQLSRWCTNEVYADLRRRAQLVALASDRDTPADRALPYRPQVLSVHGCYPRRGVLEASVHVRYGRRSRALAARFEHRLGRTGQHWVCTALDFA